MVIEWERFIGAHTLRSIRKNRAVTIKITKVIHAENWRKRKQSATVHACVSVNESTGARTTANLIENCTQLNKLVDLVVVS